VLVFWTWNHHVLSIYWLSTGGFVPSESGNLWHKTLTSAFNELELIRSAVDHGVFYSHDDKGTTIVCSSTDDFAITASSTNRMVKFKADLGSHFEMSDLGELA
jgi:hypothetical protein